MRRTASRRSPRDGVCGVLVLPQTYPPDVGGVETHLSDLTAILERRDDFRTWILCYKPIVTKVAGYLPREERGAVSIRRFWWFGGNLFRRLEPWPVLLFLYITPYFLLRACGFMLANGRQIDVIHAHGFNMGFVAMVLAALFRKRVVFQSHALYSFREGALFTRVAAFVLRRMDRILALCGASREELMLLGISADKITIYRYWIDLERFTDAGRDASRARLGWVSNHQPPIPNPQSAIRNPQSAINNPQSTGFVAFFVGRLIGIKGEGIVIGLAERFPRVTFVVAGDGPNRPVVEAAAGRLGNLRYLGLIPNTELPDYYRSADVVLVPSQYPEGFGRVICEALACGTPVIASAFGGIPDAMDDTVGVLCDGSVAAFEEALKRFLHDAAFYEAMRCRARAYACERFGPGNAEVILAAYRV
jgi:glycosyltransferase involved in cell wall biosynthesis